MSQRRSSSTESKLFQKDYSMFKFRNLFGKRALGSTSVSHKDERGQGMAEYIIIVILVAIIVLVAIRLFGKSVFNQFGNATQQIDTLAQ